MLAGRVLAQRDAARLQQVAYSEPAAGVGRWPLPAVVLQRATVWACAQCRASVICPGYGWEPTRRKAARLSQVAPIVGLAGQHALAALVSRRCACGFTSPCMRPAQLQSWAGQLATQIDACRLPVDEVQSTSLLEDQLRAVARLDRCPLEHFWLNREYWASVMQPSARRRSQERGPMQRMQHPEGLWLPV